MRPTGAHRAGLRARSSCSRRRTRCVTHRATALTILCGHYKDVDQRVADHLATEEISLGDFVLSGGEPAALAIVDATARLLPGAMSDLDSARTDSFWTDGLSAPSYTRPAEYRGSRCPRCSCRATTNASTPGASPRATASHASAARTTKPPERDMRRSAGNHSAQAPFITS